MAKRKYGPIAKHERDLAWIVNDELLLHSLTNPNIDRKVLTMRLVDKLSFEEIAQKYDCAPMDIEQDYSRSLDNLKEAVSQLIRNSQRYEATEKAFGNIKAEIKRYDEERISHLPVETRLLLKKDLSEIEGISKRLLTVLYDNDIYTVECVLRYSKWSLLRCDGLGKKSYVELSKAITALGLVMK
jgi:DNA-directed RNA polymerase alpha subunit